MPGGLLIRLHSAHLPELQNTRTDGRRLAARAVPHFTCTTIANSDFLMCVTGISIHKSSKRGRRNATGFYEGQKQGFGPGSYRELGCERPPLHAETHDQPESFFLYMPSDFPRLRHPLRNKVDSIRPYGTREPDSLERDAARQLADGGMKKGGSDPNDTEAWRVL